MVAPSYRQPSGQSSQPDSSSGLSGALAQPFAATSCSIAGSINYAGSTRIPAFSPYAAPSNVYQCQTGGYSSASSSTTKTTAMSRNSSISGETNVFSGSEDSICVDRRNSSISGASNVFSQSDSSYRTARMPPWSGNASLSNASSPSATPGGLSPMSTPPNPSSKYCSPLSSRDLVHDEGYKIIISRVKSGVTSDQISELLQQHLRLYTPHEKPKEGNDNKWSITFICNEYREQALQRLDGVYFEGKELRVVRGNYDDRRQHGMSKEKSGSGASSSSTSSKGPTIIDGFVR